MEQNNNYLNFTFLNKIQTYCDKCGQMIKKLDYVHPTHLLYDLNLCKKTGIICNKCYNQYLIKSMEKFGISVLDENGNYKNFSDIIENFQKVWNEKINEG